MASSDQPANVLTSAELKRRGIEAIEQALQYGPVHLLKRNQSAAVLLSEQHFRQLQWLAARAQPPEHSALQWLLLQAPADRPLSRQAMDAERAAERDW